MLWTGRRLGTATAGTLEEEDEEDKDDADDDAADADDRLTASCSKEDDGVR